MAAYNPDMFVAELQAALAPRGRQAELARAVSATPQTVNKWVQGETLPEQQRWRDIEQALGWEPGFIAALLLPDVDKGRIEERLSRVEKQLAQHQRLLNRLVRQLEGTERVDPDTRPGQPRSGRDGH